jgi:hypothetical protein
MHARKTAFKVKKTAGSETVLLFMLRYSISSCPKITYHGFYQALQEWSCRADFPKLLKEKASQIWEGPPPSTRHALPNQQVPLHYEARSQQQFDAEDISSTRTIPDALIPSTSCMEINLETWQDNILTLKSSWFKGRPNRKLSCLERSTHC